MNDQWYTNSSTSDPEWYDPVPRPQAAPEPRKKSRRGWWIVLGCVLAVIAAIALSAVLFGSRSQGGEDPIQVPGFDDWDGFAGTFDDYRDYFSNYYSGLTASEECTIPRVERFEDVTVELVPAGSEELTLQQVYEKCAPSVVAVTAYVDETSDDRYYWGTGIVLTEDGYIVTNAHVVEGSCRAMVTLWNDEEYDVLLVGSDSRSDIAVLKIDAHGLTPAEFCDTSTLMVGDRVVAIGNPLGTEFRSTMTEGIISGIDRDISYNGTTLTLVQTSAPINEGNSGGPLINMCGQVIGITNMKMSNSAGSVSIEGVGFAIPSQTVKHMADSILEFGSVIGRPALGLTLGPIADSDRELYELPEGLYVHAVSEGSDCLEKGIRAGDIITAVNGAPVTKSSEVTDVIAQLGVGDTMVLSVWRREGSEPTSFDVTVRLVDVNDVY